MVMLMFNFYRIVFSIHSFLNKDVIQIKLAHFTYRTLSGRPKQIESLAIVKGFKCFEDI